MSSPRPLFLVRSAVASDPESDVLTLDRAGDVFRTLSSGTARSLLHRLHEEPSTATDLADAAGTSLQNVQYHLDRLVEADLVSVVGMAYSPKGREMKVYGPTRDPLVVVAGDLEPESIRSRMGPTRPTGDEVDD